MEKNKLDSCEIKLGCHREAHCVAQGQTQSAICECNPGFYGNGMECVPGKTEIFTSPSVESSTAPECNDQEDCHLNAHCVQLRETSSVKYVCECLPGFAGDGKRYCISDGIFLINF